MATVTLPHTFSSGTTILSSEVNSNFQTIYNDYNGGISNANISGSAAISDSKLAQITTGGKVNATALTVTSQAAGDVLYYNGTNWVRLAIGTANQVLAVNSGATAVEYQNVASAASSAEVLTGTEAGKYVAPSTMVSHQGVIKAWVQFDGTGTPTISDSFNIDTGAGITDHGTGEYTVAFDADFGSNDYVMMGSATLAGELVYVTSQTASAVGSKRIYCSHSDGNPKDPTEVHLAFIGDR